MDINQSNKMWLLFSLVIPHQEMQQMGSVNKHNAGLGLTLVGENSVHPMQYNFQKYNIAQLQLQNFINLSYLYQVTLKVC